MSAADTVTLPNDEIELRVDAALRDVETLDAWEAAERRQFVAAAALVVLEQRATQYRGAIKVTAIIKEKVGALLDDLAEADWIEETLAMAFTRSARDAARALSAARTAR